MAEYFSLGIPQARPTQLARIVFALASTIAIACRADTSGPEAHFVPGQKIQVREGDTWSAATIVREEGRKFLIHYDGAGTSSDEWVLADRMRSAATPGGPTSAPAPAPKRVFANGATVEVKSGPWWKKALVINHRGDWILVDMDGKRFWRQWVEPWRVRSLGSNYDIKGWAKDNPWVHHNEDPPSGIPGSAPEEVTATSANQSDGATPPPAANRGNEERFKPPSMDSFPPLTSLAPDAAAPLKAVSGAILLPSDKAGSLAALVIAPESTTAAILRDNQVVHVNEFLVNRVDLATGRILNVAQLPFPVDALDLSPDGKLLATRSASKNNRDIQVDVWQIDGPQAVPVASFVPFAEHEKKKVEWARFADADHLLICGQELANFEIRTAKRLWSYDVVFTYGKCAISANRKYVAIATIPGIAVIDVGNGRGSRIPWKGSSWFLSVAFSPDGKQIAAGGPDSVKVWDLATGQPVHEIWTVGSGQGWRVDFGSNGYLLIDRIHLVSVAEQGVVWSYSSEGDALTTVVNGRLYYVTNVTVPGRGYTSVLLSVALPEQDVRDTLAIVGRPRMLLQSGMSVTLDVNVDAAKQQEVVDSLTAQLANDGIAIAGNQPIKVVAKDELGPPHAVKYSSLGPGRAPETFNVQDVKHIFRIIGPDGKILWARGGGWAPPIFLHLEPNQSAQQVLADELKMSERFYDGIQLPPIIPKNPTGFGTTQLDAPAPHS